MKLKKFLTLMLPSFERSRLLEELDVVRNEVKEITLPPYLVAGDFYKRSNFIGKQTLAYDKGFAKDVGPKINGNHITVSYLVLKDLVERLDLIETLVNKAFAKDVASSSITFLRANLIQYIEVASFASRYARRLLLWTLSEEQSDSNSPYNIPKAMSKAEERWIWENRNNYIRCLNILSLDKVRLESLFRAIPDMVVAPDDVEVVEQTLGLTKTDPLAFGLIPVRLNPIYYIRMSIAEWQVARYKVAVEEKRALEYRLLALKENGAPDAKLEQEITYTEGRLQKLNRKISEMEEGINE